MNYDAHINAGRTVNDISIQDLAETYKRKVLDAISKLKYKIAVFDFDGTLTSFRYANEKLLPCKDAELHEYCKEHNLYDNATILRTMQYIINELDADDVYVLTSTVHTLRKNKDRCIHANFPTIASDHIIHTRGSDEKLEVLDSIYAEHKKPIVFVEDMYKTLLNAEENFDFVTSLHISNLLP